MGKLNFGTANDLSLIKHHLYKHLLYINFVSFNRQLWNCCLKDTASFFQHWAGLAANSCNVFIILKLQPETLIHGKVTTSKEELDFLWGTGSPYCMVMLLFSVYIKHIQNRFFFFLQSKTYHVQILELNKIKVLGMQLCQIVKFLISKSLWKLE